MNDGRRIIIFDGLCVLCDGAAQFIAGHDRSGVFVLGASQSDSGKKILIERGLEEFAGETVVLLEANRAFIRSDAIVGIAIGLGGVWSAFGLLLRLVPRRVRDAAYRFVERRRRRWFGVRGSCRVPPEDVRGRFMV
jgi:predicted DCC family thiol-disulfide oxidoreductase YuxK